MDTVGWIIFGNIAFGIILLCRTFHLKGRLFRYIYSQYPEEGAVIHSYTLNRRCGPLLHKNLKDLVFKHGSADPELLHLAKSATRSSMHFLVWLILALIIFLPLILFLLAR